jgi:hypothetical protein
VQFLTRPRIRHTPTTAPQHNDWATGNKQTVMRCFVERTSSSAKIGETERTAPAVVTNLKETNRTGRWPLSAAGARDPVAESDSKAFSYTNPTGTRGTPHQHTCQEYSENGGDQSYQSCPPIR